VLPIVGTANPPPSFIFSFAQHLKSGNPMTLTAKQERFVAEYLIDLNATQAAIRAGYSAKTANRIGPELLTKQAVAAAVAERQIVIASKLDVTQERIVAELAKIGFANMLDFIQVQDGGDAYVDLSNVTRDQAAAIAEVTVEDFMDGRGEDARDVRRVKLKLSDKQGALEKLARHLGMFKDRVEHTGKDGKDLPPPQVTIFQLPDNGRS
jgi:phage terminase small subunit